MGGVDPDRDPRNLIKLIGVQLQSSGLPESITPSEAMKFFCAYHGVPPRSDLLQRLGIDVKQNTQFYKLSTGQQRKLSIALAVAHKPQILFLDEPTAGLDVAARVELHNMMRELRADGTTIILATHDMSEAEEMSDRVAIMLDGRIAATGTPMDITSAGADLTKISVKTQNGCLSSQAFTNQAVTQRLKKEDYEIFFSSDISSTLIGIISYIETNRDVLVDLRVERPSLEDRFLEITSKGVLK